MCLALGEVGRAAFECLRRERDVVNLLLVRVEKAVVPLGGGAGLLVLVEEGEEVDVEGLRRPERGSAAGQDAADEVAVIRRSVLGAGADLILVALRRPAGFGDDHLDVVEADGGHGSEDGVDLGLEEGLVD